MREIVPDNDESGGENYARLLSCLYGTRIYVGND